MSTAVYTGAQINFGDLTPYLTNVLYLPPKVNLNFAPLTVNVSSQSIPVSTKDAIENFR